MSPGQTEAKQGKFIEFISRAKGYIRENYKSQNINPISLTPKFTLGRRGGEVLRAKYLLPCCCIHDSLEFDMQHDHVLKKLNFDLLTPYSRVLGGRVGLCAKYLLLCCCIHDSL